MAGILNCGCSEVDLTFRIRNVDGTFTFLEEDANGVVTLDLSDDLQAESNFAAIEGPGIEITAGGSAGHTPTIGICADPASEIPIEFIDIGGQSCITISRPLDLDPEWGPGGNLTAGGITIIEGGIRGHNPSLSIAIGPGQPFGFDAEGRFIFTGGFQCSDLAGCSIASLGDVAAEAAAPPTGLDSVLYWDGTQWAPLLFSEFLAAQWGIPGQIVPGPPLVGPPQELRYDPGTGTFGWQPS